MLCLVLAVSLAPSVSLYHRVRDLEARLSRQNRDLAEMREMAIVNAGDFDDDDDRYIGRRMLQATCDCPPGKLVVLTLSQDDLCVFVFSYETRN